MAERTGIMRPVLFEKHLLDRFPKPFIVQPKLEGDRLRAVWNGETILLLSSSAAFRGSVPHIEKELEYLLPRGVKLELDGELFVKGMDHSMIRSIVGRTKNLHPNYDMMEYHVYDMVSSEDQMSRIQNLIELMGTRAFDRVKLVPSYRCESLDDFQRYYEKFLADGYEGIIARHPDRPYLRKQTPTMLKLKPRVSMEAKIIGFEEEVSILGKPKGTLGALILEKEDGTVFRVGTGPTHYQRDLFWRNQDILLGQRAKIRFQAFTQSREVPKMQSLDREWLEETEGVLK